MSQTETEIQWFLARDGKQHGPLTDIEMQKLVELGHLRAEDLVWKQGFSDWRAASSVFTPRPSAPPPQPPAPPPARAPKHPAPQEAYAASPATNTEGRFNGTQTAAAQNLGPQNPASQIPGPQIPGPQIPGPMARGASGTHSGSPQAGAQHGYPAAAQATAAQLAPNAYLNTSLAHDPTPSQHAQPAAGQTSVRAWPAPSQNGPFANTTRAATKPSPQQQQRPVAKPQPKAAPQVSTTPPIQNDAEEDAAHGSSSRGFVALAVLLMLLGGGLLLAYQNRDIILKSARETASASAPSKKVATASANVGTPPIQELAMNAEQPAPPNQQASNITAAAPTVDTSALDTKLQARPLWTTLKKDYPEWYSARLDEAARFVAEGKTDTDVTRHLVQSLVALRRENAKHAFAASTLKHKELASTFLANLKQLGAESADICYEFVSKGESGPSVIARIQQPEKSALIETQMLVILSAIAEGRAMPTVHTAPSKPDYDLLASELGRNGWTQADMQLFADPKALARAPHERVCKMLQDWFAAHLAITDDAAQERLLFETLKPVISGG